MAVLLHFPEVTANQRKPYKLRNTDMTAGFICCIVDDVPKKHFLMKKILKHQYQSLLKKKEGWPNHQQDLILSNVLTNQHGMTPRCRPKNKKCLSGQAHCSKLK
jgi:hypothetical protein